MGANPRRTPALTLLNEQLIISNIARHITSELIAVVAERMSLAQATPQTRTATFEALRADIHNEVDRLINEAISSAGGPT
jgi:signal recognition particle GTPase